MDPFVILTCRTQEQKSSVANGTCRSTFFYHSFTRIPISSWSVYLLLLEGTSLDICSDAEDNSMPISLSIFFSGAGSEPEWNETFIFTVSDETPQLHLKIMDSDLTNDDFVGEATYVIILIR